MIEKTIFNKIIVINDEDFDIEAIYKSVKQKCDNLGYDFVEKELSTKPAKYGDEVKFNFLFGKDVDLFGQLSFDLQFDFTKLSKQGKLDHGNCMVKIDGKFILDYKNKWGMTKFDKILLGLYFKVSEATMKRNYIIPLIMDGNEIHVFIKEKFGLYT